MSNKASLPVENLRCLRDPECKTHEYHAGHITFIAQDNPRQSYEVRQRRKLVGGQASRMVRNWEKARWGPNLELEPWQRQSLIGDIMIVLTNETGSHTKVSV